MAEFAQEDVQKIVTPLERKYDWGTEETENGIELFITDDAFTARSVVESLETLPELVATLEKEVDGHIYQTIG